MFKTKKKILIGMDNNVVITRGKEGCREVEESKEEINGDKKILLWVVNSRCSVEMMFC